MYVYIYVYTNMCLRAYYSIEQDLNTLMLDEISTLRKELVSFALLFSLVIHACPLVD